MPRNFQYISGRHGQTIHFVQGQACLSVCPLLIQPSRLNKRFLLTFSKKQEDKKVRLDDGQIEVLDDIMAEIFKEKTPAERLQIAFGMWHSARKQLSCYLRSLHPEWNEKQVEYAVAKRLSHGAI